MIRPGTDYIHNGVIYYVAKTECRGVNLEEKWARLERYEGNVGTSKLIDIKWVRFDENGGNEDG